MGVIISDAAKSAKQLAQDIAKKAAAEPFEILKEVKNEVLPPPDIPEVDNRSQNISKYPEDKPDNSQNQKDTSRLSALESEIADIAKQKIISDLQAKIQRGEEVFLENYPNLSIEEKQVLNAQIEAVNQRRKMDNINTSTVNLPRAKPGRNFIGGKRQNQGQMEATRVEKPLPPSG